MRKTDNYAHFPRGIEFDGSHFLSTGHDLHRRRRKPFEPFFSRLGVAKLEPMVFDIATRLSRRLESYQGTEHIIRLDPRHPHLLRSQQRSVAREVTRRISAKDAILPGEVSYVG